MNSPAYYENSVRGYLGVFGDTAPGSGKYAAASSGGATTTQINYVALTIGGVTYNVLIKD
jgi:hypothetical protein